MRKPNNKRGITLIALVVTIIVLLILAGISIIMLTGENGILANAINAKERSKDSEITEEIKLAQSAAMTSGQGTIDYSTLKRELANQFGVQGQDWDISEETDNPWIIAVQNVIYSITHKDIVIDENPGELEVSGDTYTINSIEDLVAFAYKVNHNDNLYVGKTVKLGRNLDINNNKSYVDPTAKYILGNYGYTKDDSGTAIKTLLTDTTGVGFVAIGNSQSDGFGGTFDGNNNYIKNLYENSSGSTGSNGGLFGVTSKSFTILNLGIKDCNITGSNSVGGIIGQLNSPAIGNITNCYSTGELISNNAPSSGICGWNNGGSLTINDCHNESQVKSKLNVGGISGGGNGPVLIYNCYNTGIVTGESTGTLSDPAGGIVGNVQATQVRIINCYNTGKVHSNYAMAGGIAGNLQNDNAVINCHNYGEVSARKYAGGILGSGDYSSAITNCYNTNQVTSETTCAGGIIANAGSNISRWDSTVSYCYNSGNINSTSTDPVGGIGITSTVTNSHNTGTITNNNLVYVGEISGYATVGADCTYLIKNSNANANGALGKEDMTTTMSITNFVTLMNSYVSTNNSNSSNIPLKTWTLNNSGMPVFN